MPEQRGCRTEATSLLEPEQVAKTGMADDNNRSYRANEPYGQPPQAGGGHGGGDPLAELARLIGQNDPFSDFARENGRAAAPRDPRQSGMPATDWRSAPDPLQPAGDPAAMHPNAGYPNSYGAPAPQYAPAPGEQYSQAQPYDQQGHGSGNSYAQPYYGQQDQQGRGNQRYYQDMPGDEMYEDVAPARRRGGMLTIVAIFTLVVIGTAAAFGYRAVFSSGGSILTPPVIKADTAPNKVVPATSAREQGAGKLIYDRVGDRNQMEKIIAREEQPVDMKDAATAAPRVATPGPQGSATSVATAPSSVASAAPTSAPNTTIAEPKKIRTVAIKPDQAGGSETAPPPAARAAAMAPASPPPAPRNPNTQRAVAPSVPPPAAPAPIRQSASRSQPAPQVAQSDPNAPLSLVPPSAAAPARPAVSARTGSSARPASVTRTVATTGGAGAYNVQVSSQRSEAEAQAAFRSLQAKFPNLLGGRQLIIRRADLGSKGIYFRAQVGPFADNSQANDFCGSLKAAGAQCLIQRN